MKRTVTRYLASTIGLLLVALGIALSIKSNLGTSPLSCPAYILSMWGSLSVGGFTIVVNVCLIAVQLAVLRSRFKLKYLMQIPASVVFGYLIDFWIWALQALQPVTLAARLLCLVACCLVTAVGVSLEVSSQGWMLSAEMTVYAFTKVIGKPFGTLKIWMDCIYVAISVFACLILFRNPFGSGDFTGIADVLLSRTPGVVIGAGTLLCAVLPGFLMRFTDPLADSVLESLRKRDEDRKWRNV